MASRRYGILFPLAALVACGGGTMRVAQDDGNGDTPVSLSPTPETGPADTAMSTQARDGDSLPTRASDSLLARASDSLPADSIADKGYAAYGEGSGLALRRIGQWTRTGIDEARRLVIRNANAWADFWSELGVGDRPEVDFTQNVVVAVAAGQRPTGGYEIAVERVSRTNGELTVEVVETTPGPNCMTTASLTQPVDVVVIPEVETKNWSFVERKEVRGCR
jgi:hypothetical protein